MAAVKRFFDNVMGSSGEPDKVALDKSCANKAAIDAINASRSMQIVVRQIKYVDNVVEQDHRAIKRVTRPMLNCKSFYAARFVLAGVELMHITCNGQVFADGGQETSFAAQSYAMAGQIRPM